MEYKAFCTDVNTSMRLYLDSSLELKKSKVDFSDTVIVVDKGGIIARSNKGVGASLHVYRAVYVEGKFPIECKAEDMILIDHRDLYGHYTFDYTNNWFTTEKDACEAAKQIFPDSGSHNVLYIEGCLYC